MIVRLLRLAIVAGALHTGLATAGQVTREEALALAFPGATITAERVFLTDDERRDASTSSGEDIPSALVARYLASLDGRIVGRAYVDTHVVRTKKETLLVSLTVDGRVRRVDITAFIEPKEYLPSAPWLRQYGDRPLDPDLAIDRAIRPIAGATLTARAVNGAVRRVMAIDAVLRSGAAR